MFSVIFLHKLILRIDYCSYSYVYPDNLLDMSDTSHALSLSPYQKIMQHFLSREKVSSPPRELDEESEGKRDIIER